MSNSVDRLFDSIPKLPTIPEVVRAIINQLNDPHAEMPDIARNVEKEQVIALKVLRLVNSAHFGLSQQIGSIDQATVMLGVNQLKTLVIATGIVGAIPKIENFDIKTFWKNSFRTAVYAKWIAEKTGLSGDIAYTAGLIGNLGTLLIHMAYPEQSTEIDQRAKAGLGSRSELERHHLGFSAQSACAELCRRWHFADDLTQTIEQSEQPMAHTEPSKLACVLHLARFISDCVYSAETETQILTKLPVPVTNGIGLPETFFRENLAALLAIKSNFSELLD